MPSKQVFSSQDGALYTTSTGAPISAPYAAQRIGKVGPLLLQGTLLSLLLPPLFHIPHTPSPTDFHHIDLLAHFDRERIPGMSQFGLPRIRYLIDL